MFSSPSLISGRFLKSSVVFVRRLLKIAFSRRDMLAICSGLIIFPACTAYNIDVDAGPNLLFVTLPNVFNNLPGGQFWGTLFFVFM